MSESYTRAILLLLIVVALLANVGDGPPRLSFISPPTFVSDSAVVTYQLRIPRHEDNRWYEAAAYDVAGLRVQYSRRDLDGDSPSIASLRWRLAEGPHQLIAVLYGSEGEIARARHQVTVYRVGP